LSLRDRCSQRCGHTEEQASCEQAFHFSSHSDFEPTSVGNDRRFARRRKDRNCHGFV
jgi:hypothetical protein